MPFVSRDASSVRGMSSVASNIARSLRRGEALLPDEDCVKGASRRKPTSAPLSIRTAGMLPYPLPGNGVRLG
jgi:hypothetical protein